MLTKAWKSILWIGNKYNSDYKKSSEVDMSADMNVYIGNAYKTLLASLALII